MLRIIILIIAFSCSLLSDEGEISDQFLYYSNSGAYGPYSFVDVKILNDGQTTARYMEYNADTVTTTIQLTKEDMSTLKALIEFSEFFKLSDPGQDFSAHPVIGHAGVSKLEINLGKNDKALNYSRQDELDFLTGFLWKIIRQAQILHDFESKGDVYSAQCGISPTSSCPKILQPEVIEDLLRKYIQTGNDYYDLQYALEGLSYIRAPEQWFGIIWDSYRLSDEERQMFILMTISSSPFYSYLTREHLRVLYPLFIWAIKDPRNYAADIPEYREDALSRVCIFLEINKCKEALPALKQLAKNASNYSVKGRAESTLKYIEENKYK